MPKKIRSKSLLTQRCCRNCIIILLGLHASLFVTSFSCFYSYCRSLRHSLLPSHHHHHHRMSNKINNNILPQSSLPFIFIPRVKVYPYHLLYGLHPLLLTLLCLLTRILCKSCQPEVMNQTFSLSLENSFSISKFLSVLDSVTLLQTQETLLLLRLPRESS